MTRSAPRTPDEESETPAPRPAYVAATLTYVRTPDGVVQVDEGDPIPDTADTEHLDVLVAAGAVVDPATVSAED